MEKFYNLIQSQSGVPIKAWTKGVAIEAEAEKQFRNSKTRATSEIITT